jgi:histone H3/H4
MSSKISQRRSKLASPSAEAPSTVVEPTEQHVVKLPGTVLAAPVSPEVAAVAAVVAAATETSSRVRGSKRKAGVALEGERDAAGADKKLKGGKKSKDANQEKKSGRKPRESKETKDESKAEAKPVASSSAEGDKAPASSAKPRKPRASKVASESVAGTPAAEAEPVEAFSDGNPNVSRYLRSLLKAKYPDSTISKEAIQEVQRLVYQFGLHFLVTVKRHLESAKKNTLMPPDMPICLQRVLSGSNLYNEFFSAMRASLTRYCDSYPDNTSKDVESVVSAVDEKRKQMWAARAGLSIPPTRIKEFAKQYLSTFRFSQHSITGLTALLERLAILVFQLSFEKAQELSRKRISQADVQSAVKSYPDLQWLSIAPQLPIV